eukprot:g2332.t1
MTSVSQFFVLSPRGDTIISREYRTDIPKGTAEIFFRKVKFWKGDAPPVFNMDGVNYISVKKSGLYFVGTTRFNVSPCLFVEIINRLTRVFKDYCGTLSEESVRKNFILIYELLDEVLDYGVPQDTSTELLKQFIHNEPVVVQKSRRRKLNIFGSRTTAPSAVQAPVHMGRKNTGKKNEIFVDILERLTVLFNSSGNMINSTVDGCIQMKSYLSGNPLLRLALNEDLVIGKENAGYGGCVLDNCNFHECVKLDDFEETRKLNFLPPEGEFVVMNYRMTSEFDAPFKISPLLEAITDYQVEMILKIRADIPTKNYGANVQVTMPVPKSSTTVTPSVETGAVGQVAEYREKQKKVFWAIRKFPGKSEFQLRVKVSLASGFKSHMRKEFGPIAMRFEIPMYNASQLQVRYLRIADTSATYKPKRWVRYVTQSNSYVCRV